MKLRSRTFNAQAGKRFAGTAKKRVGGGCSWTDPEQMKPVNGWLAQPTKDGFCVYGCPEFERDTWCIGRYRTAEDYNLALEIRLTDTRNALKKAKKTPDNFRKMLIKKQKQLDELMWHASVHMSD